MFSFWGFFQLPEPAYAASKQPSVEIPSEWREHLDLDRGKNIPYFINHIFSEPSRAPVPVYHFDVPLKRAQVFVSKSFPSRFEGVTFFGEGAAQKIRFFIVDSPGVEFQAIAKELGRRKIAIHQEYWGARVQSNSTYLVWNPKHTQVSPFFIKTTRTTGTDKTGFFEVNSPVSAESAVRMSEFLENHLGTDPEFKNAFLREPFAASLEIPGVSYAYSVRVAPEPSSLANEDFKLLPLHGFLGSDWPQKFAKIKNLSVEQWMTSHYLPKLAKFCANLNYRFGLYPVLHTQNLVAYVDVKKAEIVEFRFRDLNDVMIDPLIRLMQQKSFDAAPLRGLGVSQVNTTNIDDPKDKTEIRLVGSHFNYYTSQSVWVDDSPKDWRMTAAFLDAYLEEVTHLTGGAVQLSRGHRRMLRNMRRGLDPDPPSRRIWGDDLVGMASSNILQGVYDRVMQKLLPVFEEEALVGKNQSVLKRLFRSSYYHFQVAFPFADSKQRYDQLAKHSPERLRYVRKGPSIWAFDSHGREFLATAYGSTECSDLFN